MLLATSSKQSANFNPDLSAAGVRAASNDRLVCQNIHAGVNLSIARAAFAETLDFLRTKSRPWIDSRVASAQDDPLTVAKVGEVAIWPEAAEALLERAGHRIDATQAETTEEAVVAASLAVAAAKVLASELAIDASSVHFALAGTSSVKANLNLDHHWRNARTHTLHDTMRWKYHVVGNLPPGRRHPAQERRALSKL